MASKRFEFNLRNDTVDFRFFSFVIAFSILNIRILMWTLSDVLLVDSTMVSIGLLAIQFCLTYSLFIRGLAFSSAPIRLLIWLSVHYFVFTVYLNNYLLTYMYAALSREHNSVYWLIGCSSTILMLSTCCPPMAYLLALTLLQMIIIIRTPGWFGFLNSKTFSAGVAYYDELLVEKDWNNLSSGYFLMFKRSLPQDAPLEDLPEATSNNKPSLTYRIFTKAGHEGIKFAKAYDALSVPQKRILNIYTILGTAAAGLSMYQVHIFRKSFLDDRLDERIHITRRKQIDKDTETLRNENFKLEKELQITKGHTEAIKERTETLRNENLKLEKELQASLPSDLMTPKGLVNKQTPSSSNNPFDDGY